MMPENRKFNEMPCLVWNQDLEDVFVLKLRVIRRGEWHSPSHDTDAFPDFDINIVSLR